MEQGRCVADERGRRLVAFAEPESQHVVTPDRRIGDFANLRRRQIVDGLSHALAEPALEIILAALNSSPGSKHGATTGKL